jgi:hypothetical protein
VGRYRWSDNRSSEADIRFKLTSVHHCWDCLLAGHRNVACGVAFWECKRYLKLLTPTISFGKEISTLGKSNFFSAGVWLQDGIFCLASFFYLLFRIHPVLGIEAQSPVFLLTYDFFKEFLGTPGGFTDWLGALFLQFWFTDLLSALYLTIFLWLVAFLTRKWVESVSGRHPVHTFHLIPACLFLVLHCQYDFRLSITLAMIINLFFLILFVRWTSAQYWLRFFLALAACIFLFWITGGAFLIFAVLYGLFEVLFRKKIVSGILLLLVAALLPWLASQSVLLVTIKEAYRHNLVFEHPVFLRTAAYGIYIYLLLALIVALPAALACMERLFQKISGYFRFIKPAYIWKWVAGTVLVLAAAGLLLSQKSENDTVRLILQVNRAVKESRWSDVLSLTRTHPYVDAILSCQINLAMFQTNQLLDKMFVYPQKEGTVCLLPDRSKSLNFPEEISNLCWKLGLINASLHWAHESMVYKGTTADILKRLGVVYMVRGDNQAARLFLNRLKKIPFNAKTADGLLRLNENHTELVQSSFYHHIYLIMPKKDMISLGRLSADDLEFLLQQNPKNRMAFEYLIAYYLLDANAQGILKHIADFATFAYSRLPVHVQEALIINLNRMSKPAQEQVRRWIHPRIYSRYMKFQQILNSKQGSEEQTRYELWTQFGDTYWYYLVYVKPAPTKMESGYEFQ